MRVIVRVLLRPAGVVTTILEASGTLSPKRGSPVYSTLSVIPSGVVRILVPSSCRTNVLVAPEGPSAFARCHRPAAS